MYADKVTDSMKRMMDETNRRREKQIAYNIKNNITPTQIFKSTRDIMGQTAVADGNRPQPVPYYEKENTNVAADPLIQYLSPEKLHKLVARNRKAMEEAVKSLDFLEAARLRDEVKALQEILDSSGTKAK
jgi:excinuclease ABC subunit B